jgi:hypothetical protein
MGFEPADFGLADSVKFLEGQGASAAVGGKIGRERLFVHERSSFIGYIPMVYRRHEPYHP